MPSQLFKNKVVYFGQTLIDLSEDTITPEQLRSGVTAHDASGAPIVGTRNNDTISFHDNDMIVEPGTNRITFDGSDMIIHPPDGAAWLERTMEALEGGVAIISTNNAHAAITNGQYVYIRMHETLPDGLYKATTDIAQNAELSSSNVTSASGALNDKSNVGHTHDDRYYTESETDTKLSEKLSLSGGIMTGALQIKNNGADISASSIPSGQWFGIYTVDKNNRYVNYWESAQYTHGETSLNFGVRRRNGDTNVDNNLQMLVNTSGTRRVLFNDPAAWRNGLGASSGIFPLDIGGTGASNKIDARKNLGYIGMFFAESVNAAECIVIPNNTNLNTPQYCATGKYVKGSNVDAQTLINCPTGGIAFQMLVFNLLSGGTGEMTGSWDCRTRIIMTYQGNIWIQGVTKSGDSYSYGAWMKVTMTSS